jgi:uncharacterized metal-binding protein
MPGAHAHDVITVVTGAALAPIAYVVQSSGGADPRAALTNSAILVAAHLVSGIMFSPDLDLDSRIDNRWGIFFWIWRPYMWVVPHRNFWSHGLILPPLLRLLYFYLVLMLLLIGGAWLFGRIGVAIPDYHVRVTEALLGIGRDHPRETWAFVIGFVAGSAAHTIADWLVTGGKLILHNLGFRLARDYSDHDSWRHRYRRERSWRERRQRTENGE